MKTITRPLRTIQGRSQSTPGLGPAELVTFLAAEPRYLESLMAETGLQTSDLRAISHDSAMLEGVVDWILSSDDRITALSTHLDWPPDQVAFGLTQLQGRTSKE